MKVAVVTGASRGIGRAIAGHKVGGESFSPDFPDGEPPEVRFLELRPGAVDTHFAGPKKLPRPYAVC
ncbi:hypothetical protein ADU37_CDS17950 [Thermococcus sp. 2319x1]|nr:hypothetical protein ADU37_CDS17950 [Thermococcus sp. 2319x1]